MSSLPASPRPSRRPDLADRRLVALSIAAAVTLAAFASLRNAIPADWMRPGSPLLQTAAIVGSLLLLAPWAFSIGKRGGLSRQPNRLFVAHVLASLAGAVLVGMHALASLAGPPLVIVACLLCLLLSGAFARLRVAPMMAATLGTKTAPFAAPDPALRARLRAIIDAKRNLLARLDPRADEALFSVTLRHWARAPRLALAYQRLVRREAELIGARRSVPAVQAWWRPLHIALAWLFVAALFAHVVVVVFFAGYAADGEIYWWHLADWGR
ncbi:MAG: hypothetical protein R3E87_14590 [Burkholderiaceae bacterium]